MAYSHPCSLTHRRNKFQFLHFYLATLLAPPIPSGNIPKHSKWQIQVCQKPVPKEQIKGQILLRWENTSTSTANAFWHKHTSKIQIEWHCLSTSKAIKKDKKIIIYRVFVMNYLRQLLLGFLRIELLLLFLWIYFCVNLNFFYPLEFLWRKDYELFCFLNSSRDTCPFFFCNKTNNLLNRPPLFWFG